ncbi:MAG: hypothetical protein K9J17_18060 [Flavobacteriales bacterium]|nr:hypothetical protein [Flavobacteriales bacterium]
MLTLKECRELLSETEKKYTDDELKSMIDFLTEVATITITNLKNNEDEKARSHHVPCIK